MIEVSVSDSRALKAILESISEIVDEAAFIFEEHGFCIEGADPSIISKVDVSLSDAFFESYHVDSAVEFGVDMTSLDKIAKRILPQDTVTLISRDRENMLEVVLNGGIERKFDAALIELNNNLPKISLDFPATMVVETEAFRNCVRDLAVIGGSVVFDVFPERIVMTSTGELGTATVTIQRDNPAVLDLKVSAPCSAKYNLSYLMSFLKAGQISDCIAISLGDRDFPLKLEFSMMHGSLVFYLAPMEY
jgi:proliferating cell nuclear antigen PCNA